MGQSYSLGCRKMTVLVIATMWLCVEPVNT
jgi:hypothetical protein